jgi:hypothetical protein
VQAPISLKKIVEAICQPDTPRIPDTELKRSEIYFRLTNRKYVLKDGQANPEALLGGSPYVFFTVPETGFGRSLYGVYSDFG